MINDEEDKVLHDKASRGERLSEAQLRQLEEWYAYQDRLELAAIQPPNENTAISDLRAQIETALNQLVRLTNRIQRVAVENAQLHQENAILLSKIK